MDTLSASVDDANAQSDDTDGSAAPQSGESGDPIVDWTTSGTARWMIDTSGCLTIAPLEGEESGELEDWRGFDKAPWHDNSSLIISAKIEGAIAISTATGMFYGCSSLKFLDLSSLGAWRARDMPRMFEGCSSLQSLDLSGLDASSAGDMSRMFSGCSSLQSLDLSGLDASSAWDMSRMFEGCSSLKFLDMSGLDASSVTDMSYMFYKCSSLESLDLPSLGASSAENMSRMFYGCSSLASLDLPSLDASKVTDMSLMFYGCSSLKFLDLSSLDASKVTNMSLMFYGCSSLRAVKLGESFAFAGGTASRLCSLPRPSGDGCTGLWLSSADGKAYAPKDVPSNVAATYTAQVSQAKVDISSALVSDVPDQTYTGAALKPAVEVAYGGERLAEGVDYTVSYGDNVEPGAGAGSVTVSAVEDGNFTGSVTVYFDIEKKTEPAPVFPDVDYGE